MNFEVAASNYANSMIHQEYDRQKKINEERFNNYIAEHLEKVAEFENGWHKTAIELAQSIRDKSELFIKKANWGMLHPTNKISRRLFEEVTGLSLPNTVSGTNKVVFGYCGAEIKAFREQKQAEKQAIEDEREQKKQHQQQEYLKQIRNKIINNNKVESDELIDFARSVGVEVAPATCGMMRKRVHWVTADQIAYTGKRLKATTPCKIYQKVRERLNSET